MVVLKRKAVSPETEKYEGYDSVIELDDRKSFAASQKETAEPEIYTRREAFIKPREEVMPSIKKETKPVPATAKEAVSAKAKVLLAAYIIIAVVLAAVVIGTGIALTEIGNRNVETAGRIVNLERQIDQQTVMLDKLDDPTYQRGRASELNMVDAGEPVEIAIVPEVEVPVYAETEDLFGRICDFLSRIFN